METKEIFSNWTPRQYFQVVHQGNIFKMETMEIFSKWTARICFEIGQH